MPTKHFEIKNYFHYLCAKKAEEKYNLDEVYIEEIDEEAIMLSEKSGVCRLYCWNKNENKVEEIDPMNIDE